MKSNSVTISVQYTKQKYVKQNNFAHSIKCVITKQRCANQKQKKCKIQYTFDYNAIVQNYEKYFVLNRTILGATQNNILCNKGSNNLNTGQNFV